MSRRRQGEWLLGEWAAHALQGEAAQSRDHLREAAAIGAELEARSGDRLLRAAAAVIQRAEEHGDREALAALERGHAAFHAVRGDAIYSECDLAALHTAESLLAAAGSPFVDWVRLDQAVCAYFDEDFPHAEAILTILEDKGRSQAELALQARAEWILGLLRMVQARFVEAVHYYSAAIDLFSRLGEEPHAVYLRSLRAKSYEFGGARQEAWRERLATLAQRGVIADPERRFTIFEEAVQALRSQGYPVAALAFLSEQMRAAESGARQTGKTDLLAFTLLARASLLADLGRREAAAADVAGAEHAWSRLSAGNESRLRLRSEIDVQRSQLEGANDERALSAVDRALHFFSGRPGSLGDQIQILTLDRLRAQIEERRGDLAGARADLLRGAAELERQRLELATPEDRARFLAQRRGLFLDLVHLELDGLHDPWRALKAVERSSNRVLADNARLHLGGARRDLVLDPEALRRAFPPGTLVVRFGHLPDRLLIWTFLAGRMELEQRPVPETELARQIHACRDLLAQGGARVERELACDLLARTVLPRRLREVDDLRGSRPLLLIPDEILASLPFAALRAAPRAPYLVERLRLSYCPSLYLWLSGLRAGEPRRVSPPRSALFVSDPAFSRDLFPSLSRLPAARRAVPSYASHYPDVEILSDRQATVPALLAALDRFEILHFDGHGITNSQFPERGGLLLAPAAGTLGRTSSLLTSADLTPRSLGRLRLVILGACSTGLTTYRESPEVTGLAAAFLAHGVPAVVAAAWKVPDQAAADLLDRFHQSLAAGLPADEALQTAQLAMLHSAPADATRTATWAAFQVLRAGR